MKDQLLRILAERLGYSHSQFLPRIVDLLVNEEELKLILATPGTPKDIAQRTGKSEDETARMLFDLYMRGLAFMTERLPEGPKFDLIKTGAFMDAILFDPRYDQLGETFFDLWKRFYNEEYIVARSDEQSGFRVLPVEETIRSTRILPYERASEIIKGAWKVAVTNCPCRRRERNCSSPLETCLILDDLADYVLSRHIGREITKAEALDILKQSESHNLVHQTVNTNVPNVVCNCCPCCCALLRAVIYHGIKAFICKSRFGARINKYLCKDCATCVAKCHFSALRLEDGKVMIQEENCFGCGLCTTACPNGALSLQEVRGPEYIGEGEAGRFFISLKMTGEGEVVL